MKEIRHLAEKNDYFGEMSRASLTEEMKRKSFPLLMLMVMKRNGDLKTRGCALGQYERLHTDKAECSSLTPDLFAFKHICAAISLEKRDVAMANLPGFFLQVSRENE